MYIISWFGPLCICFAFWRLFFVLILYCTPSYMFKCIFAYVGLLDPSANDLLYWLYKTKLNRAESYLFISYNRIYDSWGSRNVRVIHFLCPRVDSVDLLPLYLNSLRIYGSNSTTLKWGQFNWKEISSSFSLALFSLSLSLSLSPLSLSLWLYVSLSLSLSLSMSIYLSISLFILT